MKQKTIHRLITGLLVLAAILVMVPASALAIGTASGTAIGNTPTVSYTVGGTPQPLYTAPTATFVVDTKVIFTVQKTDAGPVPVPPSSTNRVLNFQLSNESNASVRFLLTASDLASGETATWGVTGYNDSNVDTTARQAFVDADLDGSYDAGEEYVTVPAGAVAQTVDVLVHSTIPAASSGQYIVMLLTAQAVDGAGAPLAESATDTVGVDIVRADGAGTDDAARGGTFTDRSAYTISAAIVSINKTATTIWDPYNYDDSDASKAKAIPGALIRYTVEIRNDVTASDSAVLTTVTDALNGNLAIDPDLLAAADAAFAALVPESAAGSGFKVTHSSGRVLASPLFYTTTATADGIDHDGSPTGGTITATVATLLPIEAGYAAGELKPNESVTITFNVIVQ